MRIEIPFGNETITLQVDLPDEQVAVARSKNPPGSGSWAEVVGRALPQPLGARPIREENLRGKRVVVITDDWGRPTPAAEVVPLILDELAAAGADDAGITFVTASGMHDPMPEDDLARKLGRQTLQRFRCISHDGGDHAGLAFVGISGQGTPIWVDRAVAEADYKIALGRIYLHPTHGYEGGYKMILPGVSSFETIVRDHSFNFAPSSVYGVYDNPSRRETDAVGRIVGIDFLINVVVNAASEPVKAFCGETMTAHERGIEFGDREVWAAEVPARADVVVASPGSGRTPSGDYDTTTLYHAALAAKESATIICAAPAEGSFEPEFGQSTADEALLNAPSDQFNAMLPSLSLSELLRLHEKRDWQLSERQVQWRIKSIRGDYYRRRALGEIARRQVVLTPDPDAALRDALARADPADTFVTILPEARTTLPKETLFRGRTPAS